MFTLKHKEANSESLHSAEGVSLHDDTDGKQPPMLHAYGVKPEGGAVYEGHCQFGDGLIYVMNDHGATVGKYDLDLLNEDWHRDRAEREVKKAAKTSKPLGTEVVDLPRFARALNKYMRGLAVGDRQQFESVAGIAYPDDLYVLVGYTVEQDALGTWITQKKKA